METLFQISIVCFALLGEADETVSQNADTGVFSGPEDHAACFNRVAKGDVAAQFSEAIAPFETAGAWIADQNHKTASDAVTQLMEGN